MSVVDPVRLSKTMAFLLRHKPEVGHLQPDDDGWVDVGELCRAVSTLLRNDVAAEQIAELIRDARVRRFELSEGRVRAVERGSGHPRATPPDILYHPTSEAEFARMGAERAARRPDGGALELYDDEGQAWRAAHRSAEGPPRLLYVDTARARRHGARFHRNRRTGLYLASGLSVSDVLNLQPNFAEQISAGGIPVQAGPDGRPRMALIRVTRRSGVTWEVAKGKLEPGETPEMAAVREVQEEMGVQVDFSVTCFVGLVRYGFMAPGALPRLKSIHLFLLEPKGDPGSFSPSAREGIGEVRWFDPEEAERIVRHSSLVPMMARAKQLVQVHHAAR